MRNLAEVTDRILKEIPNDWPWRVVIVAQFDKIINNAAYTAPEIMNNLWIDVADVLSGYIGKPVSDWQFRVQKIFAGEL